MYSFLYTQAHPYSYPVSRSSFQTGHSTDSAAICLQAPRNGDSPVDSRERFLTALQCQQPDRVPIFEALIDEPVLAALMRILDIPDPVAGRAAKGPDDGREDFAALDRYCLVVDALGLDATCGSFGTGRVPAGHGYVRDRYDRVFQLNEYGEAAIVDGPVREPADALRYDMAGRLRAEDFEPMRHIVSRLGRQKAHIIDLSDPFKVSWLSRGSMENFLVDMVLNPDLVYALARIATDFALATVEMAAGIGVDGFLMDGDYAGEVSVLMSRQHYVRYFKECHAEIVRHVHRHGLKVIKHSDGNNWPIFDDFVDAGFDAFHPVQPQCMDLAEVRRHAAGRICLIGNIDCRDLLCSAPEEEVEEAVRATIGLAAPGGGYIISSSNSIHPGVRPENYLAMVRAAHRYGGYPQVMTDP